MTPCLLARIGGDAPDLPPSFSPGTLRTRRSDKRVWQRPQAVGFPRRCAAGRHCSHVAK